MVLLESNRLLKRTQLILLEKEQITPLFEVDIRSRFLIEPLEPPNRLDHDLDVELVRKLSPNAPGGFGGGPR